jgi:ATP-dependent DNA helicase DinG
MGEYMRRALMPDMLVKAKQGFGRVIRTESDTGVCAFLDLRAYPGAAYHRRLLGALPECGGTTDISDIEPFLRERKPKSYFMEEEPLCKAA